MQNAPIPPIGRQILWIISAMVLCIVVPLLVHEATGGPQNERNAWWSIAIIVFSGMAYAAVLASSTRQLFAMVLWLFTYLFMGVAPYVQYRLNVFPSTTPDMNQTLIPTAGILVLASSVAVIVGGWITNRQQWSRHAVVQAVVDRRRANWLTIFGIGLFLFYGSRVGFTSFLLSRTDLAAVRGAAWGNSATSALLTGALQMVLLVAFIAQMTLRRQPKSGGRRAAAMPALISGALLLYTVNPISSPRYVFGTVALAVLGALGAYATVTRFRVMAVAALVGMLTLFPLADLFRYSRDATVKVEGPIVAMTSGDFDAFAQIVNTLTYVDAQGVTWGWQMLGVLLFWVPRSIWPNKPHDTGIVLAEFMRYDFTNLSSPIWAELLINFGWVGVIIGMGLIGYWFRIWDARTHLYLRTHSIPPVVVCVVAFYLLIVLRGSLLNAASYLLVILLASWFVAWKPPRRTAPAPQSRGVHEGPAAGADRRRVNSTGAHST
ncbi:O-antigen polymerase [Kocuria rosea]|uniref:O-antigen polymerase n=1 Tax=Kocuria rosea TaxID=1275 RepID=UPI00232BE6CC|nr:O-antigen polymerase [Kocuria rosea]